MIFIIDFQFQVHLTCLSGSQMGQSPLEQKMDLGHSRKVQSKIFLNQGVYFEYTQLLPGVEMILLIPGAKGTPLLAGIFGQIWTSPISKVGWYFLAKMDYWPLFFDQFGLVLFFGWY